MVKRSGILIGTAGVYHVAAQLAARGFHAAITFGNAPAVDILVGQMDGTATLSIQVKTSLSASRTRGQSKQPHHFEWDLGNKSANLSRVDLHFAFVDLKLGTNQLPDVFIVPSKRVFDASDNSYLKSGTDRRWRWHPTLDIVEPFKNNWTPFHERLRA